MSSGYKHKWVTYTKSKNNCPRKARNKIRAAQSNISGRKCTYPAAEICSVTGVQKEQSIREQRFFKSRAGPVRSHTAPNGTMIIKSFNMNMEVGSCLIGRCRSSTAIGCRIYSMYAAHCVLQQLKQIYGYCLHSCDEEHLPSMIVVIMKDRTPSPQDFIFGSTSERKLSYLLLVSSSSPECAYTYGVYLVSSILNSPHPFIFH